MRLRDVLGPFVVVGFVALFVYMLAVVSAPDSTFELGDFVIIGDLIVGFVLLMVAWGPLMNGENLGDNLPVRVPAFVGIPLGVVLFVFLYVSGLGEILLHVNEVGSPVLALGVAACILGGATYLSTRSDPSDPETASVALSATVRDEVAASAPLS